MFYFDRKNAQYFKNAFKIAWPCIVETLLMSAVFIIDAAMVGRLGAKASAAVGVNQAVNWLINSLAAGIAIGATVLVAAHCGAEELQQARNVARQAIVSSLIFGFFMLFALFFLSNYIPVWVGADEEILPDAIAYLKIVSFSICLHFTRFVCSGILRGSGNTKIPMQLAIFTNVFNICGNFLLIYPTRTVSLLGTDYTIIGADMGVRGAAISTALAQALSGAILLITLFNRSLNVHVRYDKTFRLDKKIIAHILKIGLPTAGERVSLNVGMVVFQAQVANLGTIAISAHYLANTIESLSYMPAEGFGMAATTLVGQSLGAGRKDDAIAYSRIIILSAALIGAFCGVFFFLFPNVLFGGFSNDADVIRTGSSALRIMSIVEPFLCASIVTSGVLRGAGDTKTPFAALSIGIWGFRLAFAWLFAYRLGLGLTGAWIGMAIDLMFRFTFLRIRYLKKKWLNIKVRMERDEDEVVL